MPYVQPRQPLAAFFQSHNDRNFTPRPVAHYLVDMPTAEVPYSRNDFLLAELVSVNGQKPKPGIDIVIFHSMGKIVLLGQVTSVVPPQSCTDQSGSHKTLVSCVPMSTIAHVDVPEGHEHYLVDELVAMRAAIEENRCPPTSRGQVPKGALMRDQSTACEFVFATLVDAAFA